MMLYAVSPILLIVSLVSGQSVASTVSGDAVILPAPAITEAPPPPTATLDSSQNTIAVETAVNKDLIFHYPPFLQDRLSSAVNGCNNQTEQACFDKVQNILLSGSPELQKRIIGLAAIAVGTVAVLVQLLTSATIASSGRGKGFAKVPPSIRIPTSDVSAVQSAISASKSLAIGPQPSAIATNPWPINQGIQVDTVSEPNFVNIVINDGAIYDAVFNWRDNHTCETGTEVRRRDSPDCIVNDAVQLLKTFADQRSTSHAFQSLIGMPRLPSVENPLLLTDISKFLQQSAGIEVFSSLDTSVKDNVALGMLVIRQGASSAVSARNNLLRIKLEYFQKASKGEKQFSSRPASRSVTSYFLLPETDLNIDLAEMTLSQKLAPTPIRRHRFLNTEWDYWDLEITSLQARQIWLESNEQIRPLEDVPIARESFDTTAAPAEAPNPTSVPEKNQYGKGPLLRQNYQPADEYADLIDYSVENKEPFREDKEREYSDYVFPDLKKIDTWVYLIEEGVDSSHPTYRIEQDFDSRVWTQAPIAHPDLRWEKRGAYGNVGNGRGTCLASKLAGTRFGVAKNTMIIFVAVPLKLSSLWWTFAAIHKDIVGRRSTGIVKPRQTFIVNGLSWPDVLVKEQLFGGPTWPITSMEVETVVEQIRIITETLQVPLIQGVKGKYEKAPYDIHAWDDPEDELSLDEHGTGLSDYSTVPALWATDLEQLQLMLVAGSNESLAWDSASNEQQSDRQLAYDDTHGAARSQNVVCALPQGGRTMVRGGSAGLAAVAAAGTLLNKIALWQPYRYSVNSGTENPGLLLKNILADCLEGHKRPTKTNRAPADVFNWKRTSDEKGPPIMWNGLIGRKELCSSGGLRRRQAGNSTEQCAGGEETNGTQTSGTNPVAPQSSFSSSSIQSSTMGTPPGQVTSAPALPSLSTWSMECSSSSQGQTKLPKDYATTGIADFCTSTSRSSSPTTIAIGQPNAQYYVPRKDNTCGGIAPLNLGLGLFRNEAAAQDYQGWPQDICGDLLKRIAEQCEWGGTQRVGFFEGSLTVARCGS